MHEFLGFSRKKARNHHACARAPRFSRRKDTNSWVFLEKRHEIITTRLSRETSTNTPPCGKMQFVIVSSPADNLRNVLAAAGLLEGALARSLVFRTKSMKSEKHACFNSHAAPDADTGLARWNSHVLVDAAPMMPMMLAQEASIIDIIGVPFLLPKPPAPRSSLKPCWPALRVGPACKMAPARMLMMLSWRAAWNAQKPSLCWGFPTKTPVFGTLARCAAPRRPGEKRRSHEARSAALCARPLLLRSRPFVARALAGHQKGRACAARFKSLRLRPPTPEAYGKTADFGTLCIPAISQRLDPSAALLSSTDRIQLAALNVMLTPCPVP